MLIEVRDSGKDGKQSPKRLEFIKDLYITNFRSFIEISFEVEGSSKPTQAVVIVLIQLVDKLQFYDALVRIVKYKTDVRKCK